jgi:hypothetical protein
LGRRLRHFADDILIRVPGRSEWAGERRGRAAVAGYIEAVRTLPQYVVDEVLH